MNKTDLNLAAAAGDDRPVVRWPRPQIRKPPELLHFTEGDRTVLQVLLSPEALAELEEAGGEIEVQIVPLDPA